LEKFCRRALAASLCALVAFAAAAEMPAIGGSTGFKRIKVSESTAGKRITVQIDPVAQAAYLASMPKVDPDGPCSSHELKLQLVLGQGPRQPVRKGWALSACSGLFGVGA
jgi:hypothetical protein